MSRAWKDGPMLHEIVPPDTVLAFSAMKELRPALAGPEAFADQVDGSQRAEGYRLVGAFPAGSTEAVAVAGFRLATSLSWGRHIYIDDLSTVPSARGRGYGGQLLAWIHEEAGRLGCAQVHLDSGVGSNRYDAHRLYFKSGYVINAHHFIRTAGA